MLWKGSGLLHKLHQTLLHGKTTRQGVRFEGGGLPIGNVDL
jgi:hypothetical protein